MITELGGLLNKFGDECQNFRAIRCVCCPQFLATGQKPFYPLFLAILLLPFIRWWVTRSQKWSLCSGSKLKLISTFICGWSDEQTWQIWERPLGGECGREQAPRETWGRVMAVLYLPRAPYSPLCAQMGTQGKTWEKGYCKELQLPLWGLRIWGIISTLAVTSPQSFVEWHKPPNLPPSFLWGILLNVFPVPSCLDTPPF